MKILIIYAHPSVESYNHALLEAFLKGLKKAGHDYEVVDLYRENFNPILSDTNPRAELGKDVKAYQERIKAVDYLAFVFPTFWYRAPAMLEGFIDRVFTSHFAYKYVSNFLGMKVPKGLLPDKKAIVIETYGGPGWYYRYLFSRIPWKRFRAVLKFCGIKVVAYQPCYHVPFTTDKVRQKYIRIVQELGEKLK
jgi:NAD(P)H dehydrogenase (quinone)